MASTPVFTVQSAFESIQGKRWNMEDAHVVIDDLTKTFSQLASSKLHSYYAVYDGHGGQDCAKLCEQMVHYSIFKQNDDVTQGNFEDALKKGYIAADKSILFRSDKEGWKNGSTAVSVLLVGDLLYVANLGDSEAVLVKQDPSSSSVSAVCVSEKHKPSQPSEKARIEKSGGHVIFGRVLGSLAVSRAFGDIEFKHPYNKSEGDFVSAEPFVAKIHLDETCKYLIIACDGLWDKLTYAEAAEFVQQQRSGGKSLEESVKALVKLSFDKGSMDNITTILVELSWGTKPSSGEGIAKEAQQPKSETNTN